MPLPDADIVIRRIKPGDRLTGLRFGKPEFHVLKAYLQKNALAHQANSLAVTYGAFDEAEAKVWGYITLACGEVVSDDSDDAGELVNGPDLQFSYRQYPAVKIARLAVHQKAARSGLGRELVRIALGQAKSIVCPAVGCRFMMVDSKRDAVEFYLKCGFTMLDTPANRARSEPVMYLDLNRVDRPRSASGADAIVSPDSRRSHATRLVGA